MKKKLLKLSLTTLSILITLSIATYKTFALDLPKSNESVADDIMPTYDENNVDWENIDEINVVYSSNIEGDQFIKDALSRGIKVSFDTANTNRRKKRSLNYFSSVSWLTRNGVVSLSVMPNNAFNVDKEASWQELARYFQYHPMYTSVSNSTKFNSLYNQYICHANLARNLKLPWNIEPSTPDKGYWGFVTSWPLCN
ncbi:DUF2599 domain-containing protein [Clostridium septicum]|uniref:DUF2599 domain-containing protein n=1 Tax=Clostridium septicum TaxID=1504 RepID=UPI00272E2312|nr:DUF2599 domain-containing protein [Clostridium septicum]WLF70501.1 DUF2599 domain-containing protein [Clostridium septicum]